MGEAVIVNLNKSNWEEEVQQSSLPVLVDFWAQWCGPCKMLAPVLAELAGELNGKIKIGKVNVDENPQSAGKYSVMSIPTTVLFKGGQEIGRQVGFAGKDAFEELIKKGVSE